MRSRRKSVQLFASNAWQQSIRRLRPGLRAAPDAPEHEVRNLVGVLHRDYFEARGPAAGDAGGGIFQHQRGTDAEAFGGQKIGIRGGLLTFHTFAAYNGAEMAADSARNQQGLDFHSET